MKIAKLTLIDGEYNKPFIKIFTPTNVIDDNGNQHASSVFKRWTDEELRTIGYTRVTEDSIPTGKISSGNRVESYDLTEFAGHISYDLIDDPLYLNKLKIKALNQVKSKRDSVRDAGINWSPDEGINNYVVQTDGDSRRELTGAVVTINESGNTEQVWRMMDNELVILPAADFKVMALTVSAHVTSCYIRQAVLEATVNAYTLVTISEFEDIHNEDDTITQGDLNKDWPDYYIETEGA